MYRKYLKRFFDIIISGLALICLSPLLMLVAVLIKIESEGPLFYLQERVGKGGKLFSIYKFRSMTTKPRDPSKEQTFMDNPEITRIGKFIRRTKIDELPQLINVFWGDMSIIGPRPAQPSTYEEYGEIAKGRLAVRPGLSGLSQIRGNIFLSWEQRFVYDQEYIDKMSLLFDIGIIIKTFAIIIMGEDKFVKQ